MSLQPPKWANRFLEWYCRPDRLEEIQGDLWEIYLRKSPGQRVKADFQFVWNVIRFFRWKNLKRKKSKYSQPSTLFPTRMFKSYLLTGYRNMVRNLLSSSINVIGLAVALGCGILMFILIDSYYNLDAMHERKNEIYLVANHVKTGDETRMWANSPHPMAASFSSNSVVETTVRIDRDRGAVRVGDKVFQERIWFVDPSFMNVFSFKVLAGNRQALTDKNQVILTKEMAIKYFGTEDPVGQSLSIKFNENQKHEFVVGAVAEDTPANSSMYFNFLLPMEKEEELKPESKEDWTVFDKVTFVVLKPGGSIDQLSTTLDAILATHKAAQQSLQVNRLELIPLKSVAERSYEMTGSLSWSNAPAAMVGFGVIATLLILLACFNYMNVAVASVSTRLKEIGIRKVVGGGKKEIIQQFLVENMLTCFVALIGGTLLAYFFFVPGFDSLYPVKIAFEFSSWYTILTFFGGVLIFVALVSGAYPALYISSFNPVKILRGKEKFGSKSLLSKILLGGQFTLSFTTIISCLVFVWADFYFERIDWGYDHAQNIVVPVLSKDQFAALRDKALQDPEILQVAGSQSQIGFSNLDTPVRVDGQDYHVAHLPVGEGYLETMNVRLKAGRLFDASIASDKKESVVINESFAKKMGWKEPIGKFFESDSARRYVIGVVENFHYDDFFVNVNPLMFTLVEESKFNFLVVKAGNGHVNQVMAFLQKSWKEVAPDDPWRGFLQDDVFRSFFESNKANNTVGFFISGVAVLLACMGLYGLVSYNLTRRLKEYSIRKVFGAKIFDIFRLMNRDYAAIVLISFFIGAPIGSYLINMLINSVYPDPIPLDLSPYIITVVLMITTVALTLATQLFRVSSENPTRTLRIE